MSTLKRVLLKIGYTVTGFFIWWLCSGIPTSIILRHYGVSEATTVGMWLFAVCLALIPLAVPVWHDTGKWFWNKLLS